MVALTIRLKRSQVRPTILKQPDQHEQQQVNRHDAFILCCCIVDQFSRRKMPFGRIFKPLPRTFILIVLLKTQYFRKRRVHPACVCVCLVGCLLARFRQLFSSNIAQTLNFCQLLLRSLETTFISTPDTLYFIEIC